VLARIKRLGDKILRKVSMLLKNHMEILGQKKNMGQKNKRKTISNGSKIIVSLLIARKVASEVSNTNKILK